MTEVWCPEHKLHHDLALIERFAAKTKEEGKCPVVSAMEVQAGTFVPEPEYIIMPKDPTTARWPMNIDLLITKLPTTEKDGYTQGLVAFIAQRTFQNMNPNSLAFVVVSSYKEQKERPYMIVEVFKSAGFQFIDTIVWEKNKYTPTQGGKRLNNVYDFVFLFAKGDNYHLDRKSIAYLRADGHGEYLCAGNLWRIKVDDKDSIPQELAECAIKLAHLLPNSKIVDPLMDTGAVLKAALKLQHSFWGTEANALRFKRCQKVVRDYRTALLSGKDPDKILQGDT